MPWNWKRFFVLGIFYSALFYFAYLPAKGITGWDRLELAFLIGVATGTASASVKTN